MTGRTLADARRWLRDGTARLLATVKPEDAWLDAPSALPGWTRRHVVAHVAANAEALGNLVHWAATGEPTPMYASADARAAGIERGRQLPAGDLVAWLHDSAHALDTALDDLDDDQWQARVVTAQGRTVPATEIAWLRSREVEVHAVDLAGTVTFADLPADFLAALCDDVVGRRTAARQAALELTATDAGLRWRVEADAAEPVVVTGRLDEIAAYLTGRDHALTTTDGRPAPVLPAWL